MKWVLDAERRILKDVETDRVFYLPEQQAIVIGLLLGARGRVVSNFVLEEALGHTGPGWDASQASAHLRVLINRLRARVPTEIHTVQNFGYFVDDKEWTCPTCGRAT